MEPMGKLNIAVIFQAPKWAGRLSNYLGFVFAISCLAYVAYVSSTNHLGWPEGDEQLNIAGATLLAFIIGWLCVRICFGFIRFAHSRILTNAQERSAITQKPPVPDL